MNKKQKIELREDAEKSRLLIMGVENSISALSEAIRLSKQRLDDLIKRIDKLEEKI